MSQMELIHKKLLETKKTIALAESCTGGRLATLFTFYPGASTYFIGSFIAYSKKMKETILNVSKETLQKEGAVSRNTAHEMWLGLMKLTEADFGVSTTGIAGPSGATPDKPLGLAYIGVGAKGKKPHVFECFFQGSRTEIIEAICNRALEELHFFL